MSSNVLKLVVLVLVVGVLSACGSQPTASPASQPTDAAVPATEAPANTPAATEPPAAGESTPASAPAAAATVSFANDVLPILESRCINCHGGDKMEKDLSLKSYSDVMAGGEDGTVIVPGDAANSMLVDLVTNQKMPKRGPKLTPPQVQLIADWVNQGALDN